MSRDVNTMPRYANTMPHYAIIRRSPPSRYITLCQHHATLCHTMPSYGDRLARATHCITLRGVAPRDGHPPEIASLARTTHHEPSAGMASSDRVVVAAAARRTHDEGAAVAFGRDAACREV